MNINKGHPISESIPGMTKQVISPEGVEKLQLEVQRLDSDNKKKQSEFCKVKNEILNFKNYLEDNKSLMARNVELEAQYEEFRTLYKSFETMHEEVKTMHAKEIGDLNILLNNQYDQNQNKCLEAIKATKHERNLAHASYDLALASYERKAQECKKNAEESKHWKNMYNFVGNEVIKNKRELKNEIEKLSALNNRINSTLSIAGGLAAGYVVYSNPEMLVNFLQTLNYQMINSILPYAKEIAGVCGGIIGYAVSSYLGAPILFGAMKLIEGIDYTMWCILKGCVNLIKEIVNEVVSLMEFIYDYRGTFSLFLIAGILAYYNQGLAKETLFKGIDMVNKRAELDQTIGTEYAIPALNGAKDGILAAFQYGSNAIFEFAKQI